GRSSLRHAGHQSPTRALSLSHRPDRDARETLSRRSVEVADCAEEQVGGIQPRRHLRRKEPTMKLVLLTLLMSGTTLTAATDFDQSQADRFARLALDCVHKEYPNKIAHSLNSDADVKPPRELTPAFYGCFDWHSSVHGHWLLARLVRLFPQAPFAAESRRALGESLTPAHIPQEVKYLNAEGRSSFERPYGLAWLLQLAAELKEFDDADARRWSAALRP